MTTPATPTPVLLTDPGYLLWAPLASTTPPGTVAGSVFTDTWDVAWVNLGATLDGSEFKSSLSVEAVSVAEFFDPVKIVTTGRSASIGFSLASATAANLKKIYNGGTLVVAGSTTTTKTTYTPPAPGNETRAMIGWESLDHTVRLFLFQTINSGDITLSFKKAPSTTGLPCEFQCEVPASGIPWQFMTAGASRG